MFVLLTVVYIKFVIMLIKLKKVLSVQITLHANNLKLGLSVSITRLQQSYQDEPYQIPWM